MASSEGSPLQKEYVAPSIPHPVVTVHYGPTQIKAPADMVFETLSDVSTWPKWNSFVPRCDILPGTNNQNSTSTSENASVQKLGPGEIVRFHVANMGVPLRITYEVNKVLVPKDRHVSGQSAADAKAMYVISWKNAPFIYSRTPAWLIRFERTHEIRILDDTLSEVETWDCQAGAAAYMVKLLLRKRLNKEFQNWVEGLKKFCEESWQNP